MNEEIIRINDETSISKASVDLPTELDPGKGRSSDMDFRFKGIPHRSDWLTYCEDGNRMLDSDKSKCVPEHEKIIIFENGDSYKGEYQFNKRHGHGTYRWSDGRVYTGEFHQDMRHGKGQFSWPDGATYEGEFYEGQRAGHGKYNFPDGGYYDGSWKDGNYDGYGECQWDDGRIYKGEWREGKAHGKGIERYPNGRIRHDGQWMEDKPVWS